MTHIHFRDAGPRWAVKALAASVLALSTTVAMGQLLAPVEELFEFVPLSPGLTAENSCAPDNAEWQSYQTLIGAMHEHTGYSDGAPGTRPADAFAAIRATGLDFAGSAEHSDNARLPFTASEACLPHAGGTLVECANLPPDDSAQNPVNALDPVNKWDATLRQARAETTGAFTAFRGFEWTSDRFGHINVFFSKNDANAKADGGYATMESFWTWFRTRAELGGGADGLAAFNHPGREDLFTTSDPGFNWNDFEYVPEADLRVVGIEVFNRGSDFGTQRDNVPPGHPGWYVHALDKGWHVGPIGAEDEHDQNWGTPTRGKTVLIARDRSEAALREALLARRYYAVGPNHNDLRLSFQALGLPMGSRIARASGEPVNFLAKVDAGVFDGRLELVTNGGQIAAFTTKKTLTVHVRAVAGERWYFLRVRDASGRPIAYTAPIWVRGGGGAYPLCGEWLAGDLHVHTTYSHDSWGGPDTPDEVPLIGEIIPGDDNTDVDEFYTLGHTTDRQFRIASARGLDYLAITDHNDIRSQADPGFGAHGVVPIRGYEKSLSGHAQILGSGNCYTSINNNGVCEGAKPPLQEIADQVRADGGIFQVNHPADGTVNWPAGANWGEARDGSYEGDVVPDTVEIWNISWLWQPPAPSGSSMDDAVRYWQGWLDRGEKVGATGGGDNHWVSTTAVQGVGQPTTWVFATERSERGVIEGLRRGRSFISHQPPLLPSPQIYLEADADGDGIYEAIVGDTVPAGAALRVRVSEAAGAQVRIVTTGGVLAHGPIPSVTPEFEFRFAVPAGTTWVRAEVVEPDGDEQRASVCDDAFGSQTTYCRNRLAVLGMSSALYLE